MPHSVTITSWYANSDLNTKSDEINEQCLNVIKRKAEEKAVKGEKHIVVVEFDEMNIRKHIQWSQSEHRFIGYAKTEANNFEDDDEFNITSNKRKKSDVVNQALVIMVNAINDELALPIAYYFINSMDGNEKKNVNFKRY